MNKFGILRKVNEELKYAPIYEYIGIEIPIDISNNGVMIGEEIKALAEEHLELECPTLLNSFSI